MTVIWYPMGYNIKCERNEEGIAVATIPQIPGLEVTAKDEQKAARAMTEKIGRVLSGEDVERVKTDVMSPHHHWMITRLRAILEEKNIEHLVDPEFLEDVDFTLLASNPSIAREKNV